MKKLIIIEDDQLLGRTLELEFKEKGYEAYWAQSLGLIPKKSFDYAILDLRLEHKSGLDAIESLKESNPHIHIVILTGYGSIATTVEAMKRGAKNYLIKPAPIDRIENALLGRDHDAVEEGNQTLSQFEHEFIEYVLLQNNNNISKTAKALGLHRQSLQRKLKKLP